MAKPVNVVIKGDYNDRDVNRAIADLKKLQDSGGAVTGHLNSMKSAAIGAAAGFVGFQALTNVISGVGQFMKSAADAAIEDEAAMRSLHQTLVNVGQGFRGTGVEQFVDSLARATGTSDGVLRPALQQLVTSTNDVDTAQKALALSLDISAGTGKDVQTVAVALSAAYAGNYSAISRLKTGIDASVIASKDMGQITEALSAKFRGQASTAADTYQGKINRISVAAGEAQEMIGYSLMRALDNLSTEMGSGGATGAIDGFGRGVSNVVTSLGVAAVEMTKLTKVLLGQETQADETGFSLGQMFGLYVKMIPGINGLAWAYEGLDRAGQIINDEQEKQAKRVATLAGRYMGLAGAVALAADAAREAAKEQANNTVTDRMTAQARALGATVSQTGGTMQAWLQAQRTSLDDVSGATGSAGAAAETLAIKWKQTAASVSADLEGLKVTMGGGGEVIAGGLVNAFQTRLDAFKSIVSEQSAIVKSARDALDSYAKSVTDTVLGNVKFSTTDAAGNALTPEQIVTMIMGDVANQGEAVRAIAKIATQIPQALTQQMLTMPPDAAIALADYLANNPDGIAKLTWNYKGLAKLTENALGIPMAEAFAMVGGESATAMIDKAKTTIKEEAESFQAWVRSKLSTDITVRVHWAADQAPTLQGRASGGPVSGGTPYIVGEKGPEIFVPGTGGTIIPNGGPSGGGAAVGGNTYNITVQAGVGDPRQIGKAVVEVITLFERSSGPVFARA